MGVPRFSSAGARGGVRKVLIDLDEDGVADTGAMAGVIGAN